LAVLDDILSREKIDDNGLWAVEFVEEGMSSRVGWREYQLL
jgi:hypothetical protein